MEIGRGNGKQERRGFWRTKMYAGEENESVGQINYKGTWFLYTFHYADFSKFIKLLFKPSKIFN